MIIFAFTLVACPTVEAISPSDIPDNTLRIGNDFYDLYSDNLSNDDLVQASLSQGNLYFKFDGVWYDVFAAQSDADLGNPSSTCAVSSQIANAWTGSGIWYKAGQLFENIALGGEISAFYVVSIE